MSASTPNLSPGFPKVSVVITAYNRPELLKRALDSATAQTYPSIEIIVVDDHSPCDVKGVVEAAEKPVKFFRMPRNGGANIARNKGIDLASGAFIAFLDDDDEWTPTKLADQMNAIGSKDACLCRFYLVEARRVAGRVVDEVTEEELRHGNRICGTSGLLVKKTAIEQIRFDEGLKKGQDWDVYVRLAQRKPLAHVSTPLFNRRVGRHDSITLQSRGATTDELTERLASADKHRAWLGEAFYRKRVAQVALSYFSARDDWGAVLLFSLKRAGVKATLSHFVERSFYALKKIPRLTREAAATR